MIDWPPKDWRALLALIFSIIGAVVLTLFLWWLCAQLLPGGGSEGWTNTTEKNRAGTLRWVAWIVAGSIGLVLLGLGFAINRRSLSAKWGDNSLDWQGGEESAPARAARETAEAAGQKAEEIADSEGERP